MLIEISSMKSKRAALTAIMLESLPLFYKNKWTCTSRQSCNRSISSRIIM